MGLKRLRQENEEVSLNTTISTPKKRKGFTVGPSNLPDGTYRRKAQKIKQDLIAKAKTKSAYAKIKKQDREHDEPPEYPKNQLQVEEPEVASLALHPEREAMLSTKQSQPEEDARTNQNNPKRVDSFHGRQRKNKPSPFTKETRLAEEKEAERAEQTRAREERARDRRAMAKAKRPDRNGNTRLGRQSKVLLRRVERLISQD